MPDSMDLLLAIGTALDRFHWSSYGYDDLDIDMTDPSLDIRDALATHLTRAVEKLLEK